MYSKELSAEFLRALINGSDDAIISKTLDGNITGWNPAAEKIFGFSEDEIVGKSVLNLFPEELHHEESSIIAKIKSGQRIHHYETIRRRKDGSNFPASITVSPIQDDSGQIVGISKIVRDISERKELEDQIRLSATVFEYAREAIIIADIEGRFIHVNNSFTQITGYSIDEVIGKTPTIFKSSRQGPDVQLKLLGDLQANGKCQGEIWSRRKNGEAFAALVNVTRVTEPDGMPGRYIAIFADITVMQEQKELMERMAYFDLLTNLPNRILLAERLETSLNRVNRNKTSLAVVYLDLDGFKDINDKFGHSAGDEVLATVSKRMLAATRESDTLARIGGDEFVILIEFISGTDEHLTAIHRILAACKEEIQYDGIDFVISASAGVTVYPDDNSKSEQLLRHADQAMYQAKQAGRDRVQFFDTHQDLRAKRKYTLIADVENALTSGELFLMYQPKVDIVNGEIIGAEALIRWKTNDGRVISPLEFIRPIEELPLIDEIGIWLIKSALLEIERLATLGLNIPISVNIAPRHFLSQNFVHDVSKLLEPYRELTINQNLLEFEIVETQKFFDLNIISEIMRECTDIGVQFSLDDFGTGYSSLLYLKELPIHTLKIDRSFVTGMVKNTQELLIVKAVINLAKAFDKAVIAEGVETLEQAKLLVSLGCQNIQGYGIARPMTKGQFERWCYDWYLMERDNIKVDGIYFRGLNYDSASKSL